MNDTLQIQSLSEKQKTFRRKMLNPFNFLFFTFTQVPMGFWAGMRLKKLDQDECVTTLPYKFLNKNPFKSIYFATQSMAAELSTASLALLAIQGQKPSVAVIIVDMEAQFHKKATSKVTFKCEEGPKVFEAANKAIETGEAVTVKAKTVGTMKDGTVVSTFYFTWSFKRRK